MKKNKSAFIPIGFSSIVMVFIMICLVTFATLSVLTAHSDYRLSQKMAAKTSAYYTADATAREVAKQIDLELYRIYCNTSDISDFFKELADFNFAANTPAESFDFSLDTNNGYSTISYGVKISDVQTLRVALKINYPSEGSECFSTITRWQTVTENTPDDSEEYLNLYTGNE